MALAPLVAAPRFPGVFVLITACEQRDGLLYFDDRLVTGAVAREIGSPSETHRRVQIGACEDGVIIGSWQDPIAGIDTTVCYLQNDLDLNPADATAMAGVRRGRISSLLDPLGNGPGYTLHENNAVAWLEGIDLTTASRASATGHWYWDSNGALTFVRASVRTGADSSDSGEASLWFDADGRLTKAAVTGQYWHLMTTIEVEPDRWIPRSIQEFFAFDLAETVSILSLAGCQTNAIQNAQSWLAGVKQLESVTDHFDFDLIRGLIHASSLESLGLPSLTTLDLASDANRQRDRDLVQLACEFIRGAAGRTASFSLRTEVTTLSSVAAIPDGDDRSIVVFDDEVRQVVALELHSLTPVLLELIASSRRLEFVHVWSDQPRQFQETYKLAEASPGVNVFYRWSPVHAQERQPTRRPLFNQWLTNRS